MSGVISPMLHPAVRMLWRPDSSLQLELGTRAVVVDSTAARAVRAVPTTRIAGRGGGPVAPEPAPGPRERDVLRRLAEAGFLWPQAERGDEDDRLVPPRPRLAAELRALSLRYGQRAAEVLDARRHLHVVVQGTGRAGPAVAALLAAAGIGRVSVPDVRTVRLHQCLPGGLDPADEGRTYGTAAADAVLRAAPDTDTRGPAPGEQPDLVVLACDEPLDPDHRTALHARGAGAPAGAPGRRSRRGRAAGRPGPDQLPALRRPAPPGPRPRLERRSRSS